MKVKVWLAATLFVSLLASCDDQENNEQQNTTAMIRQFETTAVTGNQWRVTYFLDSNADETTKFSGYIFSFDPGNMLVASDGSNNHSGTWGITDVRHSDGANNASAEIDFNIVFNAPADFQGLNENWDILSCSDLKIELRHLSGGNGGADLLIFERI